MRKRSPEAWGLVIAGIGFLTAGMVFLLTELMVVFPGMLLIGALFVALGLSLKEDD